LVYFGEISFAIAVFLSIYHLSTMFRAKKRKTDKEDDPAVSFAGMFGRSRFFSKLVFSLIVLYALGSVGLRVWALGHPAIGDDVLWFKYALTSFGLGTVIAAFHLSTNLLRRRKRKTDFLRSR